MCPSTLISPYPKPSFFSTSTTLNPHPSTLLNPQPKPRALTPKSQLNSGSTVTNVPAWTCLPSGRPWPGLSGITKHPFMDERTCIYGSKKPCPWEQSERNHPFMDAPSLAPSHRPKPKNNCYDPALILVVSSIRSMALASGDEKRANMFKAEVCPRRQIKASSTHTLHSLLRPLLHPGAPNPS